MNIQTKNIQLNERYNNKIYPDVLFNNHKINRFPRLIKRKNQVFGINQFTPVKILEYKWTKWNENDEIMYKSVSRKNYAVLDNNLFEHISVFMNENGLIGTLPYLHIEGRDGWECYRRPAKNHILEFLRANLGKYDIYSVNGDLVQEAKINKRRFTLCVELD